MLIKQNKLIHLNKSHLTYIGLRIVSYLIRFCSVSGIFGGTVEFYRINMLKLLRLCNDFRMREYYSK